MKRRTRPRGRGLLLALVLAGTAVALAAWAWRTLLTPAAQAPETRAQPRRPGVEERAPANGGGEDFSASERKSLEDVLRRHGADQQQ